MAISGEWNLLNRIEKLIQKKGTGLTNILIKGIGDDAAVFETGNDKYGLLTTDISIENRHFSLKYAAGRDIGYKAMVSNISDISAMGGRPLLAFISLACPNYIEESFVEDIYQGMLEAANPASVIIAGGDISAATEIVLNIALYGEVKKNELILRSGAGKGNYIYLTGKPGRSKAGLEILGKIKQKNLPDKFQQTLIRSHLHPPIRLSILEKIKEEFSPTAMIDISDGLLSDLNHICTESKKGFVLYKKNLPVCEKLESYCQKQDTDPIEYILTSGEEYELLFTSARELKETFYIDQVAVNCIGRVTDKNFLIDKNGKTEKINIKGYDHFN